GAGRPGSRPLASGLLLRGTKNALLCRLRRPPGAWLDRATSQKGVPAGYRRGDFAVSGLPASTLRRGSVRFRLPTSPGGLVSNALTLGRPAHQPADAPGHDTPAPIRA